MKIGKYFSKINKDVEGIYEVARKARKKGLDPVEKVEVPIATSLAEKVAGLVSALYPQLKNKNFVKRIRDLEKEYGSLDPAVSLIIGEEVAKEKFCKFKKLKEGIEAGIRVGLAYMTLGVVSSPIEGFTDLKIKKTSKGEDYFCPFYSGPIRSAGGTAASFSLVIVDYLREKFGYKKYDPTEEEIKRTVTELRDYHERVTNLQYFPTEEESEFIAKNLPIQVGGEPSSKKEVSNYKDLDRVETNYIRSGFCLVLGEGIAQKAPKILRIVKKLRKKGFKLESWNFLEELVKIKDKKKEKKGSSKPTYIKDLVAGRPVLGHPSRSGNFRLRIGRARNTGYSCLATHPATMAISNNFIGTGTQLKIELPTKGAAMASCDSVEGPIVKLKNGSVRKINSKEEGENIYDSVEEIIYLGDLLVPYGDFANRNHKLMPPGYSEQEWYQELKEKTGKKDGGDLGIENIYEVSFNLSCSLSKEYGIPLHPSFIYFWSQINKELFMSLLDWIYHSKYEGKLVLPYNTTEKERFSKGKRCLELLGVPHEVVTENVLIGREDSQGLMANLNLNEDLEELDFEEKEEVLEIVNNLSEYKIIDKVGTFVGARMGRPEKAKLRKLQGSPNVLFPVGEEGGRMRSVNEAVDKGYVRSEFPLRYCNKCKKETIYPKCDCGNETKIKYYCYECKDSYFTKCQKHEKGRPYLNRKVDIKKYFDMAIKKLDLLPSEIPDLVKGVRGTSNRMHVPENLAKGVLRSMMDLQVNKDGTIRFDATEMPLTHFKPKEIGTSVAKLRELGYSKDIFGRELKNREQVLEIFPHDIILPACPNSGEEGADKIFSRAANFIDLLLTRFYDLKAFYNVESREDLIGEYMAAIAPHNCAGVAARVIGFSKTQSLLASPYIHAACRRDCDGDEIAVMLLLDLLVNFSREYLPAHRGGTQDSVLVLNTRIRAGEVDDMIFDLDIVRELPLELYRKAREMKHPSEVKIEQIQDRLGGKEFEDIGYEYEVSDINSGVLCSSYKSLGSMQEKVQNQMELAKKLRSVDTGDVAKLIIDRHFMRDIRGNLRKFSQQQFRCSKCNTKYRRPPLTGRCLNCGGKIIFTIHEGSIVKYLEPALQLAEHYEVPPYIQQSLKLTKGYIESIFGIDKEKQENLQKWF